MVIYSPLEKLFKNTLSYKSSTNKQGIFHKLVTHQDRKQSKNFKGTLCSAVDTLDCALLLKADIDFTAVLLEMT